MKKFLTVLLITVVTASTLVIGLPRINSVLNNTYSNVLSGRGSGFYFRCYQVVMDLPSFWSSVDKYPYLGCGEELVYEFLSADEALKLIIRVKKFNGYGDARQDISGYTELAVSGFEQLENGMLVSAQGGYGSESGLVQSASVEPGVYYSVYQQSPGGYSSQLVFDDVELSVVYAVNSPLPGVNWSLYGGQLRSVVESISVD